MTLISLLLAAAAFAAFVGGVVTGDIIWFIAVIVLTVAGLVVWAIDIWGKRKR